MPALRCGGFFAAELLLGVASVVCMQHTTADVLLSICRLVRVHGKLVGVHGITCMLRSTDWLGQSANTWG